MTTRTRLAAAALAVAVTVAAGCSATVDGRALSAHPPKAATVTVPSPAPAPRWVGLEGVPVTVQWDDYHEQFSATGPVPGIKITHALDAAGGDMCTLGPAVRSSDGRTGFLTAGHCKPVAGDPAQNVYRTPTGSVIVPLAPTAAVGAGVDAAVLWTETAADPRAASIAGLPVAGVMSEAEIRQGVPPGTPVCVDGAKSGVKCTRIISAEDMIEFPEITEHGDSGAPVFLIDAMHRATLIGLVKGGDDTTTTATYLAPVLARLDAAIVTATS